MRRTGPSLVINSCLAAIRLEPTADIDLGVGFAAVVARAPLVGGFLVPLENRQLFITTVDHNPPHGILAFLSADFTSITRLDHSDPQLDLFLNVLRSLGPYFQLFKHL